ncbi:MAG TPA: DUF222 domain-containing protein [Aeromicrobium sp.]|nr:DUF222 domain-containing protein [Aeromicrobium sp.]
MTVAPHLEAPELALAERVRGALSEPLDSSSIDSEEARLAITEWSKVEAQAAARRLKLIRIVDDAELAKKSGETSTSSMLSNGFGGDQSSSSRQVRTAQNLKVANLTEKALAAGEITFEKAEVIARTMAGLPESLDELTRVRVEKRLVADAKRLSLPDLRRRVMRVADIYKPREEADVDENTKLRRQEARAWQNTELWFGQARDGLVPFGGNVPEAQADLLKNQVGAIAAPRRNEDTDSELTFNQRMGRAFCHWIERIPTDGLPTTGGTPATLTVNIDYDAVEGKVRQAAGMMATGTRISASEVRRLACNHGIVPRVLDGKSVPLDQGRAKRLFTPAQRLAMADRDGGCTFPGCNRPPAWTEAHHIDWWTKDGGATDLERGTLLCARHHHWVHSEDIHIRRRDGKTEFRINGIWQTNHRWRP